MKKSFGLALYLAISTLLPASAANPDIYLASCAPSSASIISVPSASGCGIGGGKNFIKLTNLNGQVSSGITCTTDRTALPTGPSLILMEVIQPFENGGTGFMTVEACTDYGYASVNLNQVGRGGRRCTYEIVSPSRINAFTVYLKKNCTAEIGGIAVIGVPTSATARNAAKLQANASGVGIASLDFSSLPPELNSGLIYSGTGSGPLLEAGAAWAILAEELYNAANRQDVPTTVSSTRNTNRKLNQRAVIDPRLAVDDSLKTISTTPLSCKVLHLECLD